MLEHGGRVRRAAVQFGIPLGEWLDLSTGINPHARLPELLPPECWTRLPEEEDGLETAAQEYYGTPFVLPMAGSQAAIQILPRLRPPGRIAIVHPTYAEHAHAWSQAGHQVETLSATTLEHCLERFDVVVVVNPNNPTSDLISCERLLSWHENLRYRGGWLVVDEAFMDPIPSGSLAAHVELSGLILLRSLGKFFGLAGVRVGFMLAEPGLLSAARELQGPWSVTGPSRHAARLALMDRPWQKRTRLQLSEASNRLATLLQHAGLTPAGGTPLFQWVPTGEAQFWWSRLAMQGILVRMFTHPSGLRFGLPGQETSWHRLADALAKTV